MSPRKLVAELPSDDKTIPDYGAALPPNYYCRGRNSKRKKYCTRRAGHGTDHLGVGRCKFHGGTKQNAAALKNGKYSKIGRPELRKRILEAAEEENPLDMLPTLAKAKGILTHAIAEYANGGTDVALADLNKSVDTVSKVVFRIEQQRGMIAKDRVRLFMEQLYDLIEKTVRDDALRAKLIQGVDAIRA